MPYVSTDLGSSVSYGAGEELSFELAFTAPEAGTYYLLGALYDGGYNYIVGSLFGVLLSPDGSYVFNSGEMTQPWDMGESEEKTLSCRFVFTGTNVIVGLFLMKMTGDAPSFGNDIEVGSTSVVLESPEQEPERLDLTALVGLVAVMGLAGAAMKSM
ncbi:unnamed protein product [marine sediment metagenome]|uniref:Uncharacterized protein n=1 Tax=marine sediment metagenome TaxID=412755 RepID=X1FVI6_9ZZZZ